MSAPVRPQVFSLIAPAIMIPIWPTDEQAIRDFKSVWRRHIKLVYTAPVMAILIYSEDVLESSGVKRSTIRISPYPPSLSRMAARTIEPAIGASTCALGSHKCIENNGSLAINAAVQQIAMIKELNGESVQIILIGMEVDFEYVQIKHNLSSNGSDAATVQIIKYILAWIRSG